MARIIAAFAYRYEPDWLIDQLRENLSWVDGFAELDDRDRDDLWGVRAQRSRALIELAESMDPDWIYYTAPDERLEDRAGPILRAIADSTPYSRLSFRLWEMWTPDSYRTDGVWGRKFRGRFSRPGTRKPSHPTGLSIYHLKMIEPENRAERARVHTAANTWDNKARGFSYMTRQKGLTLERIPEGRGFTPPYRPYVFDVQGNG